MPNESTPVTCHCKIGKGIQKYSLEDLNEELTRKYRDDDYSLRDLETEVNTAITATTLDQADAALNTTPEEIVRILHGDDDDVSRREENRLATQLDQAGVDVETLRKDYISYRTVKNHLNDCLDVDTSRTETITLDDARATIGWARTRCENVIEQTLARLSNADKITMGDDIGVTVTPRVTCRDCGVTVTISEFLTDNGCDCST